MAYVLLLPSSSRGVFVKVCHCLLLSVSALLLPVTLLLPHMLKTK